MTTSSMTYTARRSADSLRSLGFQMLALCGLAACGNGEDSPMPAGYEGNGLPVVFSASMQESITRSSTLDNEWTSAMHVAVRNTTNNQVLDYVVQSDQTTLRPATMGTVSGSNPWWSAAQAATTFWWPASTQSLTFDAWCVNGGAYSSAQPESFTVAVDQNTQSADDYQKQDVLYAPAVETAWKQTVPLVFYHQMARVVVTVNSSLTEGAQSVTGVTFGSNNMFRTGSISNWGYTGTQATISGNATAWDRNSLANPSTIVMRNTASDATNKVFTYECLLPPQSGGNESTALITITTTPSATATAVERNSDTYTLKQAYDMKAGYLYDYNIAVSEKGKVSITTVMVYDWSSTENVAGTATVPNAGY